LHAAQAGCRTGFARAAQFYTDVFATAPQLTESHPRLHRAVTAARAGNGEQDEELDDDERAHLMRAGTAVAARRALCLVAALERRAPALRADCGHVLVVCLWDPVLSGVRDPGGVGRDVGGRARFLRIALARGGGADRARNQD
jgi:hypothetical protein